MPRRIRPSIFFLLAVSFVFSCGTDGAGTGVLPAGPYDRIVRNAASADAGVRWRTWSAAAFDEAAARGVPVLVAVTPVWSTRARELERAFSCPDAAAFINRRYVPVRVDPQTMPVPFERCGMREYRGLAVLDGDGACLGDAGLPDPTALERTLTALADNAPSSVPGAVAADIDAVLEAYHASVAAAYDPYARSFDVPDPLLPAVLVNLVRRLYATHDSETADMLHAALATVRTARFDSADGGFSAAPGGPDKPLRTALGFARAFLHAYQVTGRQPYAETALAAAAYVDSVLYLPARFRYAGGTVAGTATPDTLYRNAASVAAAALLAEIAVAAGNGTAAVRHRAVVDSVLSGARDERSGLYFRTARKRMPFYLEDQVEICRGCLGMYELTADARYAEAARTLADRTVNRFRTAEGSFTGAVAAYGPVRFPGSAASAALMLEVLSRLDFLYENGSYGRSYDDLMSVVRGCAARSGIRGAWLMTALEEPFAPLVEIFVVGMPDHAMTARMLGVVKRRYLPFARIKSYPPVRGGHRRGALIFPFFYAPVGYAALHGHLYGAFFDPAGLEKVLAENGY